MVGKAEENFKIMAISNRYKNTLNDFIDGSNLEPPDWPRLINEGLRNKSRAKDSSMRLSEGVAWTKISQTGQYGGRLRLKTFRCINTATLHPLVSSVEEYNMRRVREVERIEKAKRIEKAIKEIQ